MTDANTYHVALIGNPNSGKSTLFNRLCNAKQVTGNWAGVTVEHMRGALQLTHMTVDLVDLPGLYTLEGEQPQGLDRRVARDYVLQEPIDLIVNVIDAASLERHLYLTMQLLQMGIPMVVALNRIDLAQAKGMVIDTEALSAQLGCPVVEVSAYHNQHMDTLKQAIEARLSTPMRDTAPPALSGEVQAYVQQVRLLALTTYGAPNLTSRSDWYVLQLLLNPALIAADYQQFSQQLRVLATSAEGTLGDSLLIVVADQYFQQAHQITLQCLRYRHKVSHQTSEVLDHWLLHKWLGLPIFLAIMYGVFAVSIHIGNIFVDCFDQVAQAFFVDGLRALLASWHSPMWLVFVLADGLGAGIQVVASFIPVIVSLFLLLTAIEETGYMARVAVIMDKAMQKLGLNGQAFVPLLLGLGCNVPAVMACRTLPSQKDRIITTMMTPFMSCSARLTVYVLFASIFFPEQGALIVFSLYVAGIAFAIVTALLLNHTLLASAPTHFVMELPVYSRPALINLSRNTYHKLRNFVVDAGKVIVVMVMLINMSNSINLHGDVQANRPDSLLSEAAKAMIPVFEPMGIEAENWPAVVGLLTGVLAKEVVVASLNTLYSTMDKAAQVPTEEVPVFSLSDALWRALLTVPENAHQVMRRWLDPLGLSGINADMDTLVAEDALAEQTLPAMMHYFTSGASVYAYLLFVLLYFPCVATIGAVKKELGFRWALFSTTWGLLLAYAAAVIVYQASRLWQTPQISGVWIVSMLVLVACYIGFVRWVAQHTKMKQVR